MQNIRLDNLLLIAIETVPGQPGFSDLTPAWQKLWTEKIQHQRTAETTPEELYGQRAGIMAEFGKIICISMGYFRRDSGDFQLRVKSFFSDDEYLLLSNTMTALNELEDINRRFCFTGHNIKEFDIPFLCRRLLVNSIPLPPYLDFQNMKPWEVNMVDTFQYWRFGDYKHYTSLKLLTAVLDIPSPKEDMNGSMVAGVYYQDKDLPRIAAYCQQDVIAVANIVRRIKNLPLLTNEQVFIVA